jgi:hypothetical protein
MTRTTTAIRVVSAIWLVVVLLGLILWVPYVVDRVTESSPFTDSVVQMMFLLLASAIPAAFGLAYASHRRKVEETEDWIADLR